MTSTDIYKKALSTAIYVAVAATALILLRAFDKEIADLFAQKSMGDTTVETVKKIANIVLLMWIVIAVVRFGAFLAMRAATRRSAQSEIRSLLKTVFSVAIYIVAFFIIFQSQYKDVSLAPLFTGSTILGIVVGLALQETLGNLFAGLALQADQLFQVGDVVSIPNRGVGVVESISWRGVKIRTFQNKLLVISNAVLGKESIEVSPKNNLNARSVFFSTVPTASPASTAHIVREAVRLAENVSPKMRPVVRIRDLGTNGLDWEVKYWLENYTKYNDTDALIRERIWYAFQREKIEFSTQTHAVHMQEKVPEIPIQERVNRRAEKLSRVDIFGPLSDEEIERLANNSRTRIYAPGEAIVRRGQEGNSMCVIIRGSVKVQIPENDYQKTINTLGENDFFGEMSLLTGQPRTATVIAVEETEVLRIDKAGLKPLFESNPELVKSISDLVEERRELLSKADDTQSEEHEGDPKRGMIGSIRQFFGLKKGR